MKIKILIITIAIVMVSGIFYVYRYLGQIEKVELCFGDMDLSSTGHQTCPTHIYYKNIKSKMLCGIAGGDWEIRDGGWWSLEQCFIDSQDWRPNNLIIK